MVYTGHRPEEGGESSYNNDSLSHQQYQNQRQYPAHHQNQNYPSNNSFRHEPLQHGQLQNQHRTNGNYNNSSNNNPVPVPPRIRQRKWFDMTRTIWHYERIEQIGEGTYGQVYRSRCKDTNEIVAMKKIRVHHPNHWGMPPTVIREIKILKRLVHPNLVRMIEVVSSKGVEHLDTDDYHKGSDRSRKNKHKSGSAGQGGADKNGMDKNETSSKIDISDAREGYKGNLFLVLEYVPHDLTGLLDVAYKFTNVQIKCIFRQLLQALEYMHSQKYVHRDIKSSNILIDSNFRLKLADFGLARSIEPPLLDKLHDRGSSQEFTNKVITLWYRPPELLLGATRYGYAVDIWSAGCILAELILGRPLFTGKTELDQLRLIFDMLGTPTNKSWPGVRELKLLRTGDVCIDGDKNRKRPKLEERYERKMTATSVGSFNLVKKLLELDPSKRPSASGALAHRYFLQHPRAPDEPELLGETMKLAEGGSFHEFQTKKKRKEAKVEAEKIKQAALEGGHTEQQAKEEYDACYRGIMEKVAQEGLTPVTGNNVPSEMGTRDGLERENVDARSNREKDYRDSSSRGREAHSQERDRSDGINNSRQDKHRERNSDKYDRERRRDKSSKDDGRSSRDRSHHKDRTRSSRRESDDGRKKRHRDSSREGKEGHNKSRRDKDRPKERREPPNEEKDETQIEGSKPVKVEEKIDKDTTAAARSPNKQSIQINESAEPMDSVNTQNSTSGDKKRSDRSKDRTRDSDDRKDRRDRGRDRDHHHHKRSSKDRDKRDEDRDRKKRRSRGRSRSPERDRSRDDRHDIHRSDRDRERSRRAEFDRERERYLQRMNLRGDDFGEHRRDHRQRGEGPQYPPDVHRRGDDFGEHRRDHRQRGEGLEYPPDMPFRGDDFGDHRRDYRQRGPGGGDRGPPPRGDSRGPGGFHGPPGRHPGEMGNRGSFHPHDGRPPVDYYPTGGDRPPPGFRDRDRGPPRDRDRR